MFHVVLVEPAIPPNTGNIIRLCANTGAQLHLIEPLGFPLEDAKMRRAGLDYHEYATMKVYPSWNNFIFQNKPDINRMFALTTHGSKLSLNQSFQPGDFFIFGSEVKGLSTDILKNFPSTQCIRLPMKPNSRSLNLANSVAIIVYEAWRQNNFIQGI